MSFPDNEWLCAAREYPLSSFTATARPCRKISTQRLVFTVFCFGRLVFIANVTCPNDKKEGSSVRNENQ